MTPEDFDNLLKPFDLDAALRGKRVATAKGWFVASLRKIRSPDGKKLLIGVYTRNNELIPQIWDMEGRYFDERANEYDEDLDLFMTPDKLIGVVGVHPNGGTSDVMLVLRDLIDRIPCLPQTSLRKIELEGDNSEPKPKEKREGWIAVIRQLSYGKWETSNIHNDKYNLQPFEKAGLPVVKVEWEE